MTEATQRYRVYENRSNRQIHSLWTGALSETKQLKNGEILCCRRQYPWFTDDISYFEQITNFCWKTGLTSQYHWGLWSSIKNIIVIIIFISIRSIYQLFNSLISLFEEINVTIVVKNLKISILCCWSLKFELLKIDNRLNIAFFPPRYRSNPTVV